MGYAILLWHSLSLLYNYFEKRKLIVFFYIDYFLLSGVFLLIEQSVGFLITRMFGLLFFLCSLAASFDFGTSWVFHFSVRESDIKAIMYVIRWQSDGLNKGRKLILLCYNSLQASATKITPTTLR